MGKKNDIVRRSVVFNLSNPLHKDLYDWCNMKSSNFSDFIRLVLFNYKNNEFLFNRSNIESSNSDILNTKAEINKKYPLNKEDTLDKNNGIRIKIGSKEINISDKEAMSDFL